MQPEILQTLLNKQLQGAIDAEELEQLHQFVREPHNKEAVTEALAALLARQTPDVDYNSERYDPLLQSVLAADIPAARVVPMRRRYGWWAAAAVLLAAVTAGLFFLRTPKPLVPVPAAAVLHHDALPGQDGAVLTLANGQKIVLDSLHTGLLEEQGMRAVIREGMLVYEVPAVTDGPVAYNTMSTPRGRQFQVVLPDGTKVWLNAASSITYPTRFVENNRKVVVSGEVYFEVAKDAARPFVVDFAAKAGAPTEGTIQVLGTHFNINTYDISQGTATTLLEGSVKLSAGGNQGILQPGEQMVVGNSQLKKRTGVDLSAIMAWKEGQFYFSDTKMPLVMAELERWYDVDVVYENGIPGGTLSGEFPRSLLLSEVLRILELSGVRYRIENKKLLLSAK
ncbi:FecR family protein [Paraflavitalea pollutisoli]|uniref:FecR family protein n=1 Tax=Paraflavitalea pollutisoli TaxID=3034143 RepID=UPI0023ED5E15|nr:FecR domain-containing protein [Paraflavitalea sp. H1-2-19X]